MKEFQDPIDASVFETKVGEFGYPKWILNSRISWTLEDLTLSLAGRWEESQLLSGLSNQQLAGDPLFADSNQTGDSWVHYINFTHSFSDKVSVYGGLNNAFDQEPYLGTLSRAAVPRGRFGFLAVNYKM